jgi:hypothetical protein
LAAWPLICCPTVIAALHESLSAMTGRFESNASLYVVLTWLLGDAGIARVAAALLCGAFILWWARREADPVRFVLGTLTATALLSPVLHPWYLVWLIPAFCFIRVPALVALTATVVLSYMVWPGYLAGGAWQLPTWAHLLEYAPIAVLGLWELRRCAWGSSFLPATKPQRSVAS